MKTINRIFLFGDSWIEGQGTYATIGEKGHLIEPEFDGEQLRDWRRENSWNREVREITKCHVINFGRQGSDNYSQFGELNEISHTLTPNDLVIIGFTSKLRDTFSLNYCFRTGNPQQTILLSKDNPLNGMVAWEKLSLEYCNHGLREDNHDHFSFAQKNEKEFTENFIKDFYISLYDDAVYEHISQVNYYFYQERFKSLGLNLVCFDLFEPYINKDYVNPYLKIDKNVYLNYGEKTMNDFLQEYEINHMKEDDISLWECGHKRPDLVPAIYHPNQHGYKLYIDYLFKEILPKQYKFEQRTLQ
jgi:hypothetical protein